MNNCFNDNLKNNNKPSVENLKNTINERLQGFMFNPYTFQQRNGIATASVVDFGVSSNNQPQSNNYQTSQNYHFQQSNNYQTPPQSNNYQTPQNYHFQQPNNYQPRDNSSLLFNENHKLNNLQIKKNTNERKTNYNSLSRNLDLSRKKYIPLYDHRPVDTTQDYVEDLVEYSNKE